MNLKLELFFHRFLLLNKRPAVAFTIMMPRVHEVKMRYWHEHESVFVCRDYRKGSSPTCLTEERARSLRKCEASIRYQLEYAYAGGTILLYMSYKNPLSRPLSWGERRRLRPPMYSSVRVGH